MSETYTLEEVLQDVSQLEEVNFKVDDIPVKDRTEFVKLCSEYYDRIPLSDDNIETYPFGTEFEYTVYTETEPDKFIKLAEFSFNEIEDVLFYCT